MKTLSLKEYLAQQLDIAIENAPKVSHKGDIEHLHKFRVATRRCRSLLKLYLPDAYAFNAILKEIVQKTNELRELDVFLSMLDASKYPTLVDKIEKFRKMRFKEIWTDSFMEETDQKLHKLHNELLTTDIPYSKKELVKIAERSYQESLKCFHNLTKHVTNTELHELRIKFKGSRYALEFINSAHLKNKQKVIIECKQIQDHFGEIQDATNQLDWLKHFCDDHPCNECKKLIKKRKKHLEFLRKYM